MWSPQLILLFPRRRSILPSHRIAHIRWPGLCPQMYLGDIWLCVTSTEPEFTYGSRWLVLPSWLEGQIKPMPLAALCSGNSLRSAINLGSRKELLSLPQLCPLASGGLKHMGFVHFSPSTISAGYTAVLYQHKAFHLPAVPW